MPPGKLTAAEEHQGFFFKKRKRNINFGFGFFNLDLSTRLFIGWFGPRGIASILYILVAAHHLGTMKGHEEIFAVASLTILLSIILHGLSAKPLAVLYSKTHKTDPSVPKN
jgi:NhaP-type Na+/H+ or K+/H+ antiporter